MVESTNRPPDTRAVELSLCLRPPTGWWRLRASMVSRPEVVTRLILSAVEEPSRSQL